MKWYRIHDHKVFFNRLFRPQYLALIRQCLMISFFSHSYINIMWDTKINFLILCFQCTSVYVQAKIMFNYCNFAHSLRSIDFLFFFDRKNYLASSNISQHMWELNDTYSRGDFGILFAILWTIKFRWELLNDRVGLKSNEENWFKVLKKL